MVFALALVVAVIVVLALPAGRRRIDRLVGRGTRPATRDAARRGPTDGSRV